MANVRELSKRNFFAKDGENDIDDIRVGCLQRIADGMEVMTRQWKDILMENEYLKKGCDERNEIISQKNRQIAALKGVITRMKNDERYDDEI